MVRQPAVAGQFYSGNASQLSSDITGYLPKDCKSRSAIMVVSPHAGYVYSGATAGKVLAKVKIPRKVVLIGPNHRGLGSPAAIMTKGFWETPLGLVRLDETLGQDIKRNSVLVKEDASAHLMEHSLEVQVPFLQYLRNDFLLTPICLSILDYQQISELARALVLAVKNAEEPVLLLASTDMTHYEPAEKAQTKDMKAIDKILELDAKGLYEVVKKERISMCGVLPTAVCLLAARELGASYAELVEYTNSGKVNHDYQQVVGYAGMIVG